jgi:HEAT repeat protein
LRALYDRLDDPALRERVVRSMAEIGDGDSKRWLRDLAQRQSESVAVRDRAIRSLGEQGDLAFLERAYGSIDDTSLRERIIRVMAEAGGTETMTWLRGIARDSKESSGLRERAVRSIAEGGAPTSDLVSLYDSISDRSIRDRLVNIFADRGDKTAREKLRSIATGDPDEDLRRRATRKLTDSR